MCIITFTNVHLICYLPHAFLGITFMTCFCCIVGRTKLLANYYCFRPILSDTFSFLGCPTRNRTFLKTETSLSLLFLTLTLSSIHLTHKTTLQKISCRKGNVPLRVVRREYYIIKCHLITSISKMLFNCIVEFVDNAFR